MMMQIVGAFAEFERAMLRERTRNVLDAARKEGRVGGRRPKLKAHQVQEIVHLVNSGQNSLRVPKPLSYCVAGQITSSGDLSY